MQGVRVVAQPGDASAVTNAAGQYTISGLRAGTYTLSASKSGFSLQPQSQETTVPPDRTGLDFTAHIEMSNNFPAGINLIGVPGAPLDDSPAAVFGTPKVYRWNPDASPPAYVSALTLANVELLRVKAGRGYFVRFPGPTTLRVPGVPTDPSKTYSIGLSEGWNMIANPMPGPTAFSNFVPSPTNGVRPFAFVYDPTSGSYLLISDLPTINATRGTLMGWEGAWLRAVTGGVTLSVTAGAGTAEIGRAHV